MGSISASYRHRLHRLAPGSFTRAVVIFHRRTACPTGSDSSLLSQAIAAVDLAITPHGGRRLALDLRPLEAILVVGPPAAILALDHLAPIRAVVEDQPLGPMKGVAPD